MSLRSCITILAIAVGLSTAATAQAAQVENGLTQNGLVQNGLAANGLATNGLTANGLVQNGLVQNTKDAQRGRYDASSGMIRLKTVIMPDGTVIDLQ
jgi:hypothetical protein